MIGVNSDFRKCKSAHRSQPAILGPAKISGRPAAFRDTAPSAGIEQDPFQHLMAFMVFESSIGVPPFDQLTDRGRLIDPSSTGHYTRRLRENLVNHPRGELVRDTLTAPFSLKH